MLHRNSSPHALSSGPVAQKLNRRCLPLGRGDKLLGSNYVADDCLRREVFTGSLKGWAEEQGVCRMWEGRLLQLEFHLDLCLGGNGFAIQFERLVLPTTHGIQGGLAQ